MIPEPGSLWISNKLASMDDGTIVEIVRTTNIYGEPSTKIRLVDTHRVRSYFTWRFGVQFLPYNPRLTKDAIGHTILRKLCRMRQRNA